MTPKKKCLSISVIRFFKGPHSCALSDTSVNRWGSKSKVSSCNTGEMEERLVAYPIINRAVHYIPGGCLGFIPSTVSLHKKVTNMDLLHLCFQIFHGGGFLAKQQVLPWMDFNQLLYVIIISNSQSSDFIFNCVKVLNTQKYFPFWFDTKSKLGQVESFDQKVSFSDGFFIPVVRKLFP